MTQAQRHANGVAIPSPFQLWLGTMLRVLVELVSNVAATVGVLASLLPRDWHTNGKPADLPQRTHDPIKETKPAAPDSQTTEGLMVVRNSPAGTDRSGGSIRVTNELGRSPRSRRVYPELVEGSNHEGVLADASTGSGQFIVRVPREGGGEKRSRRDDLVQWTKSSDERPEHKRRAWAITSTLVPNSGCSPKAEQALLSALGPRLRGGHGLRDSCAKLRATAPA